MPSVASVRVLGIAEAQRTMGAMGGAIRSLAGYRVRAMSRLPYAQGIRTGYYRNGRVARKAGGTFAIDRARDQVNSTLPSEVARAIPMGESAARAAIDRGAQRVVEITQSTEARRSGDLRESYHIEKG